LVEGMARVLIVDDEASIRVSLKVLLEAESHDCTAVSDGAEALERLVWDRFDLIVLDNRLPRMTGMELGRQLRRAGDLTPIVFLSGAEGLDEPARTVAPNVVVRKPFDVAELLMAVDHLISGRYRAMHAGPAASRCLH
jgi:two-component system, OmpR family, alkaline phosphatase synthesis response regulator PhoP